MGTVYRAKDRFFGSFVALKLLHGQHSDSNLAARFTRESQLLAELRHPGIVSYVAHGQTPSGQPFLAMEWLDGEDLAHRMSHGPLKLRDTILLLAQTTAALSAPHQRDIIHRNIKPSKVLVSRFRRKKGGMWMGCGHLADGCGPGCLGSSVHAWSALNSAPARPWRAKSVIAERRCDAATV